MSKLLLLITLTLMSVAICSKPSLQYLENLNDDQKASEFLKGFFNGLQAFKDIPCPSKCDITDEQGLRLVKDPILIARAIALLINWRDLEETFQLLKEKVIDLYNLYDELSPLCVEALPAVKERLWEIERHVSRLEYIPMFVLNYLFNAQKFQEQLDDFGLCGDSQHSDFMLCGKQLGSLLHDVFLWSFEHKSQFNLE
jgi:hypothetical protein